MESMLEFGKESVERLRCIDLFHKLAQERGKSGRAKTYNWKKLSITRGRWEKDLAESRCQTAKEKAARRWLYDNNLTYRRFYEKHRAVLNNHRAGQRKDLFETTSNLLVGPDMKGLEVAAWPILSPWPRYGDTDVQARHRDGGSGRSSQHYSGKQSYIR